MVRLSWVWLLVLASHAVACRTRVEAKAEKSALAEASAKEARPEPKRFGAPIQNQPVKAFDRVLASPAEFKDKSIVVEGTVRRACSRKGCWMELASSSDPAAPGCRVTFKDYGFFVPTDSAGSSARVEANVEVAKLEPSYVAHMEQEGAHFKDKKPDGSAEEVRLVATGVELWR